MAVVVPMAVVSMVVPMNAVVVVMVVCVVVLGPIIILQCPVARSDPGTLFGLENDVGKPFWRGTPGVTGNQHPIGTSCQRRTCVRTLSRENPPNQKWRRNCY